MKLFALIVPVVVQMSIGDIADLPVQEPDTVSQVAQPSPHPPNTLMLLLNPNSDAKPDPLCADECITLFNSQYICDLTCQYPSLKHARILFDHGVIRPMPNPK